MEKLIVEEYLISKGKKEAFIKLIVRIFNDNNINEEKSIEILNAIYK